MNPFFGMTQVPLCYELHMVKSIYDKDHFAFLKRAGFTDECINRLREQAAANPDILKNVSPRDFADRYVSKKAKAYCIRKELHNADVGYDLGYYRFVGLNEKRAQQLVEFSRTECYWDCFGHVQQECLGVPFCVYPTLEDGSPNPEAYVEQDDV
jgi:hypothetical protein